MIQQSHQQDLIMVKVKNLIKWLWLVKSQFQQYNQN